ncbi:MAG: HAMP domain-containing histidine kinase [Clostridiales Family XIII bacterium]|jgi:signal transduction histidine kinase|nr:HAMP domain-containing histidine kinase [Clostridiales Family XIII bacterium]
MSVKRRLFLSNILMIIIPVALFIVFSAIMSLVLARSFEGIDGDAGELRLLTENAARLSGFLWAGGAMLVVMVGIILGTNLFLTRRIASSITAPLDTLAYGMKQVRDGKLSFRLAYLGKDEFGPVCDDFNQMAERLEYLETAGQNDEESRRELIAGISHDLRTPLTAIKAYLEGLEKGVADTAAGREKYIGVIKSKTDDLEHIIEQLFLFSKLETREFPIHAERVELGGFVSETTKGFAAEYARKGLTLQLKQPLPAAPAHIDAALLRSVFVNILENSAKYKTAETGAASVSCATESGNAVIRIADDGPGVEPKDLDKLFNVFYRADPSRSARGNGLGLAISAKIIERMGGKISAEIAPQGGLIIVIALPVAEETA